MWGIITIRMHLGFTIWLPPVSCVLSLDLLKWLSMDRLCEKLGKFLKQMQSLVNIREQNETLWYFPFIHVFILSEMLQIHKIINNSSGGHFG